jgi:O-antigen/teichoic acid export membrane protein
MHEAARDGTLRGAFFGHVNVVMLTYAVDGALAFASSALVARALGPGGRGAYALFVVSTSFGQMLLGLGFGSAALYFLNKRELSLRQIVSAIHVATLASPVVTAIAVALVVPWGGADLLGPGLSAWLLVLAVPALIWVAALSVTLQAQRRFWEMGLVTVAQPALMLALVSVAYAAGDPTPAMIVWFWIATNTVAGAVALWRIGFSNVDLAQVVRPRLAVLRRLARFGVQGETGNVLQLMNYRLDQYVVRGFVGVAGVGVYAIGVSMTEAVWLLANSVALVLLPMLTGAPDDEVRRVTPIAVRNTLLVAGVGSLALAVVAPIVIPAFFGHAYDDSVQALWWLLPGTVALTGSKVVTSYIFSRGKPFVNTMITTASLGVTLAALFALVPAYGVNGAAAASSLAYGAHFCVALIAYRLLSGQSPLGLLVPRPSDARIYTDAIRDVWGRVSGRRPIDAQRARG